MTNRPHHARTVCIRSPYRPSPRRSRSNPSAPRPTPLDPRPHPRRQGFTATASGIPAPTPARNQEAQARPPVASRDLLIRPLRPPQNARRTRGTSPACNALTQAKAQGLMLAGGGAGQSGHQQRGDGMTHVAAHVPAGMESALVKAARSWALRQPRAGGPSAPAPLGNPAATAELRLRRSFCRGMDAARISEHPCNGRGAAGRGARRPSSTIEALHRPVAEIDSGQPPSMENREATEEQAPRPSTKHFKAVRLRIAGPPDGWYDFGKGWLKAAPDAEIGKAIAFRA